MDQKHTTEPGKGLTKMAAERLGWTYKKNHLGELFAVRKSDGYCTCGYHGRGNYKAAQRLVTSAVAKIERNGSRRAALAKASPKAERKES